MRRGGPTARALSARGFQAAATDSDEEELLAQAFAASLRLDGEGGSLEVPAASGEASSDAGWVLVEERATEPTSFVAANLERARLAGIHAGRKCRGEVRSVPRSPAPKGGVRNRLYVVLRAAEGDLHGLGVGPWSDYRRHVEASEGTFHRDAVFHGFSNREEAGAYTRAAGFAVDLPTLPVWRW